MTVSPARGAGLGATRGARRTGPTDGRLAIIELREIACDESGYEGESLVGGVTDVFAHAGVHLTGPDAAGCIAELRHRIRSPALEYKANHLLREKNRGALEWFLGPDGPVHGHAHVHLVDKALFLVGRILELVDGTDERALDLHRAGRNRSHPGRWAALLTASNDLLRPRTRQDGPVGIGYEGEDPEVERVLTGLRDRLLDGRPIAPVLDPLGPAILRAVAVWGEDGRVPVAVVHDRQTSLTADRLAALLARPGAPASMRFVDSRTDARVQVADFLAGVARRAASEHLAGRGDAVLLDLLAPYVDPASIWDGALRAGR